jgi:tetratricopeptide (TPR) repeat protein
MASSNIIGIPTDEKAFEENCIPLFAGLLGDPNVKLVGTRGKKQWGLDLIGRRDRDPRQPVGIQCKLVTRGGKLTEKIVRDEVAQALLVKPPLTEFYIVTTATDEPALDLLAMTLAAEHTGAGRKIDIQVWGWDTLQQKIRADPQALNAFDPDYSTSTGKLIALGTETLEGQAALRADFEQIKSTIDDLRAGIGISALDTARSAAFEVHLDVQVDHYRDLMNGGQPRTARTLLEQLEARLTEDSSNAIRARIKANIAIARIKLGDDGDGAALLAEAYALNPSDPKTRANYVMALALSGDVVGAFNFAATVLAEDPANSGAAGLAFQVAGMAEGDLDPLAIVPAALLDDLHVRIHQMGYLLAKGASDSWWALAAETYARFPEDQTAMRMAGDALVDAALSDHALERAARLADDRHAKLVAGAALLQNHWETIRHHENAAVSGCIIVAHNLVTAYRALGDIDQAQRIAEQILALGSSDPDNIVIAAQVALDRDDFTGVIALVERAAESRSAIMLRLAALSNLGAWPELLAFATDERRARLSEEERQAFDVMAFRARILGDPAVDVDAAIENLLSTWPLSVSAHVAVADAVRRDRPGEADAIAEKASALLTSRSSYGDRVMVGQLALFRDDYDAIIAALDGFVPVDRDSEPLAWLAFAFANAASRTRTTLFFAELAPAVIALPRYSRFAGAAEHNRGDLTAAERYLRATVAADPTDLRGHLLLESTLQRANRSADAIDAIREIDEDTAVGNPVDHMRLAQVLRRAGDVERALRIGYRTAAANRDNETVQASYAGLIFLDESLPAPIGQAGPAQPGYWFDLACENGHDVSGVIDETAVPGINIYSPSHPLAVRLRGKSVGDLVSLPAEFGEERRYRVRQLKHKYIWLLHDIMASHAARFPHGATMWEVSMAEGDVQPVLDVARDYKERGDFIAQTYFDYPVPLAAVAAMARRNVLALAEHLSSTGVNLRTCLGANEERQEAARFVQAAFGKGAALDTLTLWQLHRLGHLVAAKSYFGRLCIARSTFDDLLEMRADIALNRGREFMTLGFEGDQAVRQIHTAEDTEARLALFDAAIAEIEAHCEVLPVDGGDDHRLDEALGRYAAGQLLDPIHVARAQDVILVSEDLNLRQYAARSGVKGGAWLQVTLNVMGSADIINGEDYFVSVGVLAAMRHDHVWLDTSTMLGLLTLEDRRAFALFEAAIEFIGGKKAEMRSHLSVAIDFMTRVWGLNLPSWQKGRAIGRLLTRFVNSRHDWKAALFIIDAELAERTRRDVPGAHYAHKYFVAWVEGHFFELEAIRSHENIIEELRHPQPMRRARSASERGRRRGRRRRV